MHRIWELDSFNTGYDGLGTRRIMTSQLVICSLLAILVGAPLACEASRSLPPFDEDTFRLDFDPVESSRRLLAVAPAGAAQAVTFGAIAASGLGNLVLVRARCDQFLSVEVLWPNAVVYAVQGSGELWAAENKSRVRPDAARATCLVGVFCMCGEGLQG